MTACVEQSRGQRRFGVDVRRWLLNAAMRLIVGGLFAAHCLADTPHDVELIDRSAGFTEVTAANDHRLVLGRYEQFDDQQIISLVPFVQVEGRPAALPKLDEFTALDLVRATAANQVIGVARRAPRDEGGNQRAFRWAVNAAEVEWLPLPDSFRDSVACDASSDGRYVSGYLIGRDPPRVLPCVWTRSTDQWHCQVLSTPFLDNLLLTTVGVVISDDGQLVVSSLIRSRDEGNLPQYGLFAWHRQATSQQADDWSREAVAPQVIYLADVSDAGVMVGRVSRDGRRLAVVYSLADHAAQYLLPEGYHESYATAVNAAGFVVGVAEPQRGTEGMERAFAWRNGKYITLPFPEDVVGSVALCLTAENRVGGRWERQPATARDGDQEATTHSVGYLIQLPSAAN